MLNTCWCDTVWYPNRHALSQRREKIAKRRKNYGMLILVLMIAYYKCLMLWLCSDLCLEIKIDTPRVNDSICVLGFYELQYVPLLTFQCSHSHPENLFHLKIHTTKQMSTISYLGYMLLSPCMQQLLIKCPAVPDRHCNTGNREGVRHWDGTQRWTLHNVCPHGAPRWGE